MLACWWPWQGLAGCAELVVRNWVGEVRAWEREGGLGCWAVGRGVR